MNRSAGNMPGLLGPSANRAKSRMGRLKGTHWGDGEESTSLWRYGASIIFHN